VDRLPIRWRLTIWYAAFLAVALAVAGLGLYVGLRHVLYDSVDEQVHGDAALALSAVRVDGDRVSIDPTTVASLRSDERFVRLLAPDGTVLVDTSATVGGVPIDPALVQDALAGSARTTTAGVDEGTMVIVTEPVRTNDAVAGVLQVGLSRGDADEVLRDLLLVLAVLAPLALAVAAGGGFLLAGRALAPVAAITRIAAGIGADDLHARLDLPLPDDELGRLARTFDAMLARIEVAYDRQRRFAGDAAHELRTPLSLMRSQVDLALTRRRSVGEYEEALRGLDGDLERLTGLVGTLLALARADAGSLPLDRAPMDLADCVAPILEQYAPQADEARVALRDESAPAPLVGDEDLLIQVLVNLLDNALAHTPAGGQIAVGCRSEGERVRLWVTDTGVGIPPEHQTRIFDRFYRVDLGRARQYGGTGLGLALCKAIAEAHGGTIGLTSRVGEGTRVELVLPTGR
jgi:heavy metal sensor kinase